MFAYNTEPEQEEQYFIDQGICPSCRGSGQMIVLDSFLKMEDCWECNGSGKYIEDK